MVEVTRLNALSKALGDSLASTSRAIARNRLWRSASVSLVFFFAAMIPHLRLRPDELVA